MVTVEPATHSDNRMRGHPERHARPWSGAGGRSRWRGPMAVESARSVPRALGPSQPDLEATRANGTTSRAVAVFVGREV